MAPAAAHASTPARVHVHFRISLLPILFLDVRDWVFRRSRAAGGRTDVSVIPTLPDGSKTGLATLRREEATTAHAAGAVARSCPTRARQANHRVEPVLLA